MLLNSRDDLQPILKMKYIVAIALLKIPDFVQNHNLLIQVASTQLFEFQSKIQYFNLP